MGSPFKLRGSRKFLSTRELAEIKARNPELFRSAERIAFTGRLTFQATDMLRSELDKYRLQDAIDASGAELMPPLTPTPEVSPPRVWTAGLRWLLPRDARATAEVMLGDIQRDSREMLQDECPRALVWICAHVKSLGVLVYGTLFALEKLKSLSRRSG